MKTFFFLPLFLLLVGCTSSPPLLMSAATQAQMVKEMILPAARLLSVKEVTEENSTGVFSGTGVTVVSRPFGDGYESFVITNAHVVAGLITDEAREKIIKQQAEAKEGETFIVDLDVEKSFRPMWLSYIRSEGWGATTEVVPGKIVAFDQYADVALLRIVSDRKFPTVNIPSGEIEYKLFSRVYTVGGALGNMPFPTEGIVSRLIRSTHGDETVDKLLLSSPVAEGSSGGPTFQYSQDCACFQWVAISQQVASAPKQVQGSPFPSGVIVPIYHMNLAIPLHEIRKSLEGTDFEHLLDK